MTVVRDRVTLYAAGLPDGKGGYRPMGNRTPRRSVAKDWVRRARKSGRDAVLISHEETPWTPVEEEERHSAD